jgi:hypothetical protein
MAEIFFTTRKACRLRRSATTVEKDFIFISFVFFVTVVVKTNRFLAWLVRLRAAAQIPLNGNYFPTHR